MVGDLKIEPEFVVSNHQAVDEASEEAVLERFVVEAESSNLPAEVSEETIQEVKDLRFCF